MSEKRKDTKGRNLRPGEDQMPDGRYRYRYLDHSGKRLAVYSWKLTPSDRVPAGRRDGLSLREKEQQIERDRRDGIDTVSAKKLSLNQMFERYMESRPELRPTTRNNYTYLYRTYVFGSLGMKKIHEIRYSDMRAFYLQLLTEGVPLPPDAHGQVMCSRPLKIGSVNLIHNVLNPVFASAVMDDYIRKNPCIPAMQDIRKKYGRSGERRRALTIEQQDVLVRFIKDSRYYGHWLPMITVFLGTGCRIGELIGLRWCDIDFDGGFISVNHTIVYRRGDLGTFEMHVALPKTEAGVRRIPMLKAVRSVLLEGRGRQKWSGGCLDEIDGFRDFVFINNRGHVHNPSTVNRAISRICSVYNKEEKETAEYENRIPVLLPHFSAHTFRHTFCARLCENETNVKVIQEIMGHADISTTMNIYAEISEEKKKRAMYSLEGKIRISCYRGRSGLLSGIYF